MQTPRERDGVSDGMVELTSEQGRKYLEKAHASFTVCVKSVAGIAGSESVEVAIHGSRG